MTITNKLIEVIQQGGYVFMIPLILMSILSLSVILERMFALRERKIIPVDANQRMKEYSKTQNGLPTANASTLLELIIHESITDFNGNGANRSLEKCLEINAGQHLEYLTRRLWILNAIGNLAPLLGLLGTVVGLAIAFQQIGIEGLQQESVANGISMALLTTITGLSIALPTLFALYGIKAKGERHFNKLRGLINQFYVHYISQVNNP